MSRGILESLLRRNATKITVKINATFIYTRDAPTHPQNFSLQDLDRTCSSIAAHDITRSVIWYGEGIKISLVKTSLNIVPSLVKSSPDAYSASKRINN